MLGITVGFVVVYFIVLFVLGGKLKNQTITITFDRGRISTGVQAKSMQLSSSVFINNQRIPRKYTCNGENVNPPLSFRDVPVGAKSLALVVDDPDAPMGTWVHWVVYNISPSVKEVSEKSVPGGGVEAKTSFGRVGYGGPCPPSGSHRYFFKLYALDSVLKVDNEQIESKMKGHVIGQAELVGLYSQEK